ncbi:MAG: DUF2723 domain-containing protein [Polyangiales bacterium]
MGEAGTEERRDAAISIAIGVAYFALYLATLCPVVYWYDSAEYVTAAVTLGIPHPPGYPLYVLLGHVFTWLPIDPAVAVNAMSATFAAIAVSLTYVVCRQLGTGRAPALVGAGTLGGGKLFWANAVVAEVYCPAVAVVALVVFLLLRSRQRSRFALTILGAFVAGLGLGVHLSLATLGLGLTLLVWAFDDPVERPGDLGRLVGKNGFKGRVQRSVSAGFAALMGSLIFLYLPVRAAQNPALNFGNPSNFDRFIWVVSGGTYKGWFDSDLDVLARAGAISTAFSEQLLPVGVALALGGLVWTWMRRPLECLALVLMAVGNLGFFFRYQVHDLAVFFLPTTFVLCCFVAAGSQGLGDVIARVVTPARRSMMRALTNGALVVFAVSIALGNFRAVDMSAFRETEKFIDAMVETLPEGALILNFTTPPEWQLDAVFGMYLQKVRGQRTDVDIVIPRTPNMIDAALQTGRPVYAYAQVAALVRGYELAREGPIFRVLGRRQ